MKIEYTINPLETRVLLDDADRKYLRLAIRLEAALDAISYRDIRDKKTSPEDVERYTGYLKHYDDKAYDEHPEKLDAEVADYEAELQSGHLGDCVCFACTCAKCMAESLLGIDTIAGLGKHEAHNIEMCFTDTSTRPWSRLDKTAAEVIDILSTPMKREKNEHWKNYSQEEYESHIPRWEAERERALAWYKHYVQERNL